MQKIKALFDPNRLLNPGVIINEDKHSHISNLKPMPAADNLVDRCIECGFCEPVCPSRTLTLSPRQRIVLYRELQRRRAAGENVASSELEQVFEYQGLDTCAATGLCAERCPVGINTGDLVKKLRIAKYQKFTPIARWTAEHFSATTTLARGGLKANQLATQVLGEKSVDSMVNGCAGSAKAKPLCGCRKCRKQTLTRWNSLSKICRAVTKKWFTCPLVPAATWGNKQARPINAH